MSERPDSPFLTSLAHHAADPFRLLVESVVDYAIVILDPAGNIASWNPGAERIFGYGADEIVGQPADRFCSPAGTAYAALATALVVAREDGTWAQECTLVRADGSEFDAEVTVSNLRDYLGPQAGFSMVTHDVTERKRAEDQLRHERDLSDAVLNSLPGVYYIYDENGRFMRWNKHFEAVTEYTSEEIADLHPLDFFVGDDKNLLAERIAGVFENGWGEVEAYFVAKSGKRIPYYFNGVRAEIEGKVCLIGMGIDISQQKRAQEELRASDARMRQAARAGNVGLWDLDIATGHVYYSAEWKRQLGYEDRDIEPHVREWENRLHPDDAAGALQAMADFVAHPGARYEREFRLRHKDGSYRRILSQAALMFDETGVAIRMLGSHVDVTEQRQLESQLQQAQKMEAVGQLAAGVAHDFNNLVTVINGYTDLVLSELGPEDANHAHLLAVRQAGERAGNITRQLLAFSRRQAVEPRVLDPNAVVTEAEKLLRRLIGAAVVLESHLDGGVCRVLADPGQLELVLVNLAVNARDAMPSGGTLTIETHAVSITGEDSVPPGEYARITVRDTGTGISEDVMEHLFEPFFTTKPVGSGTGLGLPAVQGIVLQSGGRLVVTSEVGHGTTFSIFLPAARPGQAASISLEKSLDMPSGTETILLVEADDDLRALESGILRKCGYYVMETDSAESALAMARQFSGDIALVIAASVLPGTTGRALADGILALRPGCRAAVLAGGGDLDSTPSPHPIVQTPLTPASLAQRVRALLDTATSITIPASIMR